MDRLAAEEVFVTLLEWTAFAFEAAGVAAIVVGAAVALYHFAARLVAHMAFDQSFRIFRAHLARGILLGLEFLVAADIIGTVAIEPSLQNLAVLAGIIAVRTFLSFSLELEIEGRWPWQGRETPRDRPPG